MSGMNMLSLFQQLCDIFCIDGRVISYKENTFGNINSTYVINVRLNENGNEKKFFLQKLNRYVFKDPFAVMKNIDLVTTHIINNYPNDVRVHFHHTADRKNYYIGSDDSFWRLSNYIDSTTFNNCGDLNVLRGAGKAFGDFQRKLNNFDASLLGETLPGFHNTQARLDKLFADAERDEYGRVCEVKEELDCTADSA